jgi:3-hydroxyisobutyrate dehydrogenase-like beta-hydroxyacid dehydrogenase
MPTWSWRRRLEGAREMKETIGWIGVGSMGHRMSRHLAKAGYALVVADAVSTEKAPPGAGIAKSNAEVAARAATVILSLPDGKVSDAVARELVAAPDRKVKTVIDTSTIGIKAAEACAALLAASDIEYVDAPVSGGTSGADKATIATYQKLGNWTPHVEITKPAFEAALDIFQHAGLITKRHAYADVVVAPPA